LREGAITYDKCFIATLRNNDTEKLCNTGYNLNDSAKLCCGKRCAHVEAVNVAVKKTDIAE